MSSICACVEHVHASTGDAAPLHTTPETRTGDDEKELGNPATLILVNRVHMCNPVSGISGFGEVNGGGFGGRGANDVVLRGRKGWRGGPQPVVRGREGGERERVSARVPERSLHVAVNRRIASHPLVCVQCVRARVCAHVCACARARVCVSVSRCPNVLHTCPAIRHVHVCSGTCGNVADTNIGMGTWLIHVLIHVFHRGRSWSLQSCRGISVQYGSSCREGRWHHKFKMTDKTLQFRAPPPSCNEAGEAMKPRESAIGRN